MDCRRTDRQSSCLVCITVQIFAAKLLQRAAQALHEKHMCCLDLCSSANPVALWNSAKLSAFICSASAVLDWIRLLELSLPNVNPKPLSQWDIHRSSLFSLAVDFNEVYALMTISCFDSMFKLETANKTRIALLSAAFSFWIRLRQSAAALSLACAPAIHFWCFKFHAEKGHVKAFWIPADVTQGLQRSIVWTQCIKPNESIKTPNEQLHSHTTDAAAPEFACCACGQRIWWPGHEHLGLPWLEPCTQKSFTWIKWLAAKSNNDLAQILGWSWCSRCPAGGLGGLQLVEHVRTHAEPVPFLRPSWLHLPRTPRLAQRLSAGGNKCCGHSAKKQNR